MKNEVVVFWVVMPESQRFGGPSCLHLQGITTLCHNPEYCDFNSCTWFVVLVPGSHVPDFNCDFIVNTSPAYLSVQLRFFADSS